MPLFKGTSLPQAATPPSPDMAAQSAISRTASEPGSPTRRSFFGSFSARPRTPSRLGADAAAQQAASTSPRPESASGRTASFFKALRSPSKRDLEHAKSTSPGRDGLLRSPSQGPDLLRELKDLQLKFDQERQAHERIRANWNYQTFKLQVLTDILVMQLVDSSAQDTGKREGKQQGEPGQKGSAVGKGGANAQQGSKPSSKALSHYNDFDD